tara:strand:- start:7919 stop:8347 length:429 start_codon:yes stop_codon:yes gene_type:complete
MVISFAKGTVARAVLAWVGPCLMAGSAVAAPFSLAIMFSDTTAYGTAQISAGVIVMFAGVVYTALFTAIPAIVLVFLVRLFGWRRGLTDAAVPAAVLFAIATLVAAGDAAQPVGWTPFIVALAGALGGWSYWHLAGRPRPPY